MRIKEILAIILLASFGLFAQKGASPVDVDKLLQEEMMNKFSTDKLTQNNAFPIGNPVNPDLYKVGPGDKLVLINITASTNQEIIEITPENLALIPRIGLVNTKGLTLTQTKELIVKEVKKRNSNAEPAVSLQQSRNVMISIEGNFQFPGTYTMPASYSLSSALNMITATASNSMMTSQPYSFFYNNKMNNRLSQMKTYSETGIPTNNLNNFRNILIIHSDGTSILADIDYALAYQDVNLNPYITEGDRVIFIPESKNSEMISISGAVINPVNLVYKKGDKAGLLMKLSGGVLPGNSLSDVIVYNNGSAKAYSEDLELSPGAKIIAKRKEEQKSQNLGIVSVMGNVAKPGIYPLSENENKLSEIINQSGGFTKDAYLPIAYILRKDAKVEEELNAMDNKYYTDLFQYSDLTMEDSTRFKNDIYNRKPYVASDFVALFEKNIKENDVQLQDGDLIVIPSKPTGVYVFGQVNMSGFISFKDKKNLEWYLEKAGGIAKGGKSGRVRVIKAKTKVWVDADNEYQVEAGDYVYVPRTPDNPPGTDIQTYNLIVTSVFALVSVLNFLFK
jgi:protein involved in polysaccharide export with SLBB domain